MSGTRQLDLEFGIVVEKMVVHIDLKVKTALMGIMEAGWESTRLVCTSLVYNYLGYHSIAVLL